MLGGTAALAAIWLLLGVAALSNWQSATLTAQFEAVPREHNETAFSVLLRFSEPVLSGADTLDSRVVTVNGGTVTAVRRVGDRSDRWALRIVPDGRSAVGIRLNAEWGCSRTQGICTQHFVPLSNRPEATVVGPAVAAAFLDAIDHHSGLDRVAVRIGLSEPIATNAHAFATLALGVTGGRVERMRRVDGSGELWEATLVPESSDDLILSLAPPSACAFGDLDCLDLQRLAGGASLTIPPATIHLTFDDGPHPVNTPIILDILKRHDARATFFVVGRAVAANPELVQRIIGEGHTLANHTWAHDDLIGLNQDEFDRTLLRTQQALGEHATPCFRPPNLRFDDETVRRAANLGLNMILNTGDTSDWRRPGAAVIAANIIAAAAPGAIVVLHDGGGDRSQTTLALDLAMTYLGLKRYAFEPVCE
ncbi:MAG: polysaccharide deacetylase family protein [Chloroflexi bacterium]|nr:polysaccharide deacetylase family protein [Chloroflexota bacterium]